MIASAKLTDKCHKDQVRHDERYNIPPRNLKNLSSHSARDQSRELLRLLVW